MPDPYRTYRPGDLPPGDAATFNAFSTAARAERDRQNDRRSGDLETPRDGVLVRVLNDTEGDLERFAIVGLDAPIFTPGESIHAFLREACFRGVVPQEEHRGKFAILHEPAKADQVVRAWVGGVTPARVDVTDPDHGFADITPGETSILTSAATGGAQILWSDPDGYTGYAYYSDEPWAVVRIGGGAGGEGGGSGYWARVAEPIGPATPDGYGGFTWGEGQVSLLEDSGGTGNTLGTSVAVINEVFEETIQDGWYAYVERRAGRWRLVTWRCPTEEGYGY